MSIKRRATRAAGIILAVVLGIATTDVAATDADTHPQPTEYASAEAPESAAETPGDEGEVREADTPVRWRPARGDEQIRARIARHEPRALTDAEAGLFGRSFSARWSSAWATVYDYTARFSAAADARRRAIGFGARDVHQFRALGQMLARSGQHEAAEAAWLSAMALARPAVGRDPLTLAGISMDLGGLYLEGHYFEDAHRILEAAQPLAPHSLELGGLLDGARTLHTSAEIMVAADVETMVASLEIRPLEAHHRWAIRARTGWTDAIAALPAPLREHAWLLKSAFALLFVASILFAMRGLLGRMRSSGELVVSIDYPDELEGRFSVRLAGQQGRFKRSGAQEVESSQHRKSTRTSHFMVSRETQFMHLAAGKYWVTVHGTLTDPSSRRTLTEPYDEQSIRIEGGKTTRMGFDVSPSECPVDVKVRWDKRPANDVGVVARGLPQSLRFATGGDVRLRLPKGTHTIAVGSGDRVAECQVDVTSYQPTPVEINLAGSENLVFKGCPPAVQLYLNNDLIGAARALERDGHGNVAHLLLARLHQEQGQTERAAEQLESAGHTLEAAELRASLSDFERAAALFEDSGEARRAASAYLEAGDPEKAGDLFEAMGEFTEAAGCFRKARAHDKLIGALERAGAAFEAAQVAEEIEDRARAIRLLQEIGRNDPNYVDACRKLVDAFDQEGHSDLAAHKLEEMILAQGAMAKNAEERSRLADLLVKADEPEKALEVLEELRRREPTHPGVASRIEGLRKTISGRRLESAGIDTKTTFASSDQRYEILEEIGRGGMGLIYKARDRRLDRIVAIKRLPEDLREHPKALKLFLNEAQAAARLNHPNIVTIFDTDQADGSFFITMELLEGLPLNALLKTRGRLGPRDTARIGAQVARGLQYAHDRQIVHRDIKTANLFLTTDRTIKIMDFGLAKMMEQVRRGTTVIGGTPYYMAPEQATGDNVSFPADIYALGITLYELCTGRVPFLDGDITYHHRHTTPDDPRTRASGIPDALAELILAMIRKAPEQRTGSSAEVERQLEAVVAAEH